MLPVPILIPLLASAHRSDPKQDTGFLDSHDVSDQFDRAATLDGDWSLSSSAFAARFIATVPGDRLGRFRIAGPETSVHATVLLGSRYSFCTRADHERKGRSQERPMLGEL